MKRIGLVIILVMLMIVPAGAQITWGVRGGLAYSSLVQKIDNNYQSGARFGFSVAGLAQIPLYKKLSLQPEVAFVNQGGNYLSNIPDGDGTGRLYPKTKCNYYSIQVPVNLVYTFQFTDVYFSVMAGPAVDFSLFGKMKTQENVNTDIIFGQSGEADLKTFDLGVNIGLQVEYSNFFFSVSALCGTLDRRTSKHDGESSLYQNNVTFSLGYYFRK
ncbi:PorT family protein [Parabacteroides sp. GYB001]|uniref:porin family protein n=1 Tax=Parabacteroides leei TaxID=2939491 RepID=UPI002016C72D|nr:porin family protein [Parabacteroides leei]MCL3850500.1 PorT family protein [Parabacteroides leei]